MKKYLVWVLGRRRETEQQVWQPSSLAASRYLAAKYNVPVTTVLVMRLLD
jgi:hypothetical protein